MRSDFMEEGRRICPVCGKEFWSTSMWIYKHGYAHSMKWFCSWKCMRQDEKDRRNAGRRTRR